uniref:Uncharacterized protein n=2 Tax=Anopheles albimanus TaxID=7167 RepID=A0A182FE22_ANOAL
MNSRLMMILFAVLVSVAVVFGLPATHDESLIGPVGAGQEVELVDTVNPQDPQAFLSWRKLKKLLLLG